MSVLPQEIQVWYVLPALRRELAVSLIQMHSLSQKKVAIILGISEGAVSQYLNQKRGINVKFNKGVQSEIEKSAAKVAKDNNLAMEELVRLSSLDDVKKTVCQLHVSQDSQVPRGCDICFK
jgi:uncharacterized protein